MYSKILVIKLDHIGDLILATPALRALREKYQESQIDILISEKCKVVLEDSDLVDNIYTYESKDFDRGNHIDDAVLTSNIETISILRRNQYDLSIGLREDLSNIPIQMMIGAKKNISFNTNSEFSRFLDDSTENVEKKHASEINFDLLELVDVERPVHVQPEITCVDEDIRWAKDFIQEVACGAKIKIAVSIGGGWFLNWWPVENYSKLIAKLKDQYDDVEIFVVGGVAELEVEARLRELCATTYISVVGKTSIKQLVALYREMDFVITNDGGPMHMATAAGTPVIALFGPSPYGRFGPIGDGNVIISHNFSCSPCPQFVQGEKPKCIDNMCMKEITVEEVFAEAERKIRG